MIRAWPAAASEQAPRNRVFQALRIYVRELDELETALDHTSRGSPRAGASP